MSDYNVITTDHRTIDDILGQLRAIKEFPCVVNIYDRAFVVQNESECWCIIQGVEIGAFLAQDLHDEHRHLTTQQG